MQNLKLKNLLLILGLNLTLVGCSSNPVSDDINQVTGDKIDSSIVDVSGSSVKKATTEQDSKDLTAEEILAKIQGKVIYFKFDRSEVQTDFDDLIKLNANYMAKNKSATVLLKGHADERGTAGYNLALGEQRANSVKNALIEQGIGSDRINTVSFGEEKPINFEHNQKAWSENRRVEFSY